MIGKLPSHKLSLAVQYASVARELPTRAQFRRWINVALQRDLNITLRIVDEPEGRELNRNYRGKDYATNVLTFVYDDTEPLTLHPHTSGKPNGVVAQPMTGDVVLCAPIVAQEAAGQHKDLVVHYAHLVIHAALHLQGYEHDSDADAARMETLETELMLKLHYPDPYQAS
jgi:probable rRNA maturation factor